MSVHGSRLVPFDLTYVRYEDNDNWGQLLAVITLSPIFVMVMYATLIMSRRDFQTCFICVGQLGNVALNLVLKKIISQPRPETSTVYILQIWRVRNKLLSIPFKVFYSLVMMALAVSVCFSRFYLHYHFADQIYVGAAVGVLVGVIWQHMYELHCTSKKENSKGEALSTRNLAQFVCAHPFMVWIGLRDYSHVEYAALEEYAAMTTRGSAKQD